MSHQGVLIAVAVFVALMLFFAPFVLRMQADANGVIDPCPQMWDRERGLYGGCMVFLPVVVKCNECLSAWPVWPGKGE
jgi:hypothetical protein